MCRLADRFGLSSSPFIQRLAPLEHECTQRIALFAQAAQVPADNGCTVCLTKFANMVSRCGHTMCAECVPFYLATVTTAPSAGSRTEDTLRFTTRVSKRKSETHVVE